MYSRIQNNANIAVAVFAFPVIGMILWYLFDFRGVVFIAAVPLAVLVIIIGSFKWKLSVYIFLVWLILEGALRKWFFPDYSSYIFMLKYVILLCPFLHFLVKGFNIKKKDYPFYPFVLIYFIWGVFELINPAISTDIRVKVLGIMVHYAFIPMLYFVPLILDDTDKILRLFKIAIIISIPLFILGIYQYYSPIYSSINKYIGEDQNIALAAGKVRITSVFSYISTYTTYLSMITLIIFIVIVIGRIKKTTMIVISIAAILAIINAFMTGSRGVVYLLVAAISVMLIIMIFTGLVKKKKNVFTILVLTMITLSTIYLSEFGKESVGTFTKRAEQSGSVIDRVVGPMYPSNFIAAAGMIGLGIGTAYQGSRTFIGNDAEIVSLSEAEYEKLVLEMGIIGYIIVLLLKISIFIFTINSFKRARFRADKIILLALAVYQVPIIIGAQAIIFNTLSGAIYWFSIGMVVSINRIWRLYNAQGISYSTL